jgi:putative peptidoglycan lipid II flippase
MTNKLARPEAIKKALFTTSALNFAARGAGYLKNIFIAALLGFNYQTDAYFFALGIIGIFSIFSGTVYSVGIPWLTKAGQKNKQAFAKSAAQLLGFNLLICAATALFAAIVLPIVSMLFLREVRPVFSAILWILFPLIILNFLSSYFNTVLRSQRLFTIQTAADFLNSIAQFVLITAGLFIYNTVWVLPWALLISLVLAVLWQLCFVFRYLRPDFRLSKQFKNLLGQFLIFAALGAAASLYAVIDKAFASYLPEKAISALVYGALISQLPQGIINLHNMSFTAISEKTNWQTLNKFIRIALAVSVPYAAVLFVLPEFLVRLILGYGLFGGADLTYTATAVRYYALALPAFYLNGFFHNVLVVKKIFGGLFALSALNILLNIAANYLFLFRWQLGLTGLVLATVIVTYISLAALWLLTVKKANM